jgi:hypothetical protein
MRVYKVHTKDDEGKTHIQVAGSQAAAKLARDGLMTSAHVAKKSVLIEETELSYNKGELLEQINDLLEEVRHGA